MPSFVRTLFRHPSGSDSEQTKAAGSLKGPQPLSLSFREREGGSRPPRGRTVIAELRRTKGGELLVQKTVALTDEPTQNTHLILALKVKFLCILNDMVMD